METHLLNYDLNNGQGRTKTLRLYNAIRNEIAEGSVKEGERLPSRRDLAEHLGISVITVENAYRMLEEEGYISVRPRSGYYVNRFPLIHMFSCKQTQAGGQIRRGTDMQDDGQIRSGAYIQDNGQIRSGADVQDDRLIPNDAEIQGGGPVPNEANMKVERPTVFVLRLLEEESCKEGLISEKYRRSETRPKNPTGGDHGVSAFDKEAAGMKAPDMAAAGMKAPDMAAAGMKGHDTAAAGMKGHDTAAARMPVPGMAKYVRRILADHPGIMLQKPPHLGCAVLRNEIALYLQRFRGMQVQPANILIGSGAEYLYGIIVQLLGRNKLYGIENPSYQKIRLVYEANGAVTELLPMGPDGIRDEALENANADILHVSPFHSYPSGVTASAAKRHAYLAFAARKNAVIVEEDFDSEFTFFKKPMETLYSLDGEGRVIYMNTFSKSIAPGMRIAYMVLPDHLLEEYETRLGFYSCTVPVFDQYVLAAFIADGGFERHLGKIRRAQRHSTNGSG